MGSVREDGGKLFFDFRVHGVRCREHTVLADTPSNRKRLQSVLSRIEAEITLGKFDYAKYFPGSRLAAKVARAPSLPLTQPTHPRTPLYKEFAETWLLESEPLWRRSHQTTVSSTLNRHLIPEFGAQPVADVSKAHCLAFRARLAKLPGRAGNETLSAKTINRILQIHSQLLAEAAERYGFANPTDRINRLKPRRVSIQPFSLDEVQQILAAVRADYRNYLTVRFFTGMRTGEVNGLQWRHVDFAQRQILVREALVRGRLDYTKTDGSQRDITMSHPVFQALKAQQLTTGQLFKFVFCNRDGAPIDLDNFTNRVWYPLLRHLGLDKRRPYQTRHTAATLWLASGENPEWVARQLGHANTEMLFKTYSRYVPNLTRSDGAAMERLLAARIHAGGTPYGSDTSTGTPDGPANGSQGLQP